MKVVVASTNPVKLEAARRGFVAMFPNDALDLHGVNVPSGVSDQPMSERETRDGAAQRAANARIHTPDADYWVGIEGGISDTDGEMLAFAWVVILSGARAGSSRSATFQLPQEVAQLVRDGLELGDADDVVFGRSNSKQQNGSVGLLTGDVIDRVLYYEHAVILALIPFKHPTLTFAP
ncbi:MAG: inosine/xanthosine triphosphatase [Chloroflexota bacterium]|nr:inosine/xanthosine triphosphatase [Chloroflexota bacterium]